MESKQRQLTIAISETLSQEGTKLLKEKLDNCQARVITLHSSDVESPSLDTEKCQVDYYQLDDLKCALKNIDQLYFPKTLPRPKARFVQASTEDLILLLKDNFLKAQAFNNIKEIIYPKGPLALAPVTPSSEKTVLSIQRFISMEKGIEWLAQEYMRWLARFLFPFLKVSQVDDTIFFSLFIRKFKLLILKHSSQKSGEQRQVYAIEGGLLSLKNTQGQLEFRMTQDEKAILAIIYNYKPRLPWPLYRISQAIIHSFVMNAFGRYLKKVKTNESK